MPDTQNRAERRSILPGVCALAERRLLSRVRCFLRLLLRSLGDCWKWLNFSVLALLMNFSISSVNKTLFFLFFSSSAQLFRVGRERDTTVSGNRIYLIALFVFPFLLAVLLFCFPVLFFIVQFLCFFSHSSPLLLRGYGSSCVSFFFPVLVRTPSSMSAQTYELTKRKTRVSFSLRSLFLSTAPSSPSQSCRNLWISHMLPFVLDMHPSW